MGCCVTEDALRRFNADGSPIRVREVTRAKQPYPDACYAGMADDATANWQFPEQHTRH